MVQWLRLCTSNAGGMGLIPGQGTEIPHATRCGLKINKGIPPKDSTRFLYAPQKGDKYIYCLDCGNVSMDGHRKQSLSNYTLQMCEIYCK